jgi:hypothetical protein
MRFCSKLGSVLRGTAMVLAVCCNVTWLGEMCMGCGLVIEVTERWELC